MPLKQQTERSTEQRGEFHVWDSISVREATKAARPSLVVAKCAAVACGRAGGATAALQARQMGQLGSVIRKLSRPHETTCRGREHMQRQRAHAKAESTCKGREHMRRDFVVSRPTHAPTDSQTREQRQSGSMAAQLLVSGRGVSEAGGVCEGNPSRVTPAWW